MEESPLYAEYGTILLDGVAYPIFGDLGFDNLNRFPQKITQGDYSFDSDDLISVRIWSDLTGGLGEEHPKAGIDDNRYRRGTLWVVEPDTFTLPRTTVTVSGANTSGCYPLGDLNVGGIPLFFLSYGNQVQQWDETTRTLGAPITTLATAPVSKPVAFQGTGPTLFLYIPQIGGYQRFDGVNPVAAQITTIAPLAFAQWDSRLWALCADGSLQASFDGLIWMPTAQLDRSETPKALVAYLNKADEDTLFIVSSRNIWGYNPNTGSLVLTKFQVPPHPDMGRGVAVWRPGEDMYISAGLQVWQWNLSSASTLGPNRGDGLPPEIRGRIVDLCPELFALYALVEGKQIVSAETETTSTDTMGDDTPYGAEITAVSSLLMWTGFGWHEAWTGNAANALPTWAMVSAAQGGYRLWWGVGGDAYTQKLSREGTPLRQQFDAGEAEFAENAMIDLGWYDAGMRSFSKLCSHVELCLDAGSPTEYIDVEYRMDHDVVWTYLGRAEQPGRTVMPFNLDASGFSQGLVVDRIRFQLTAARSPGDANIHLSPLGNAFMLKFLKLPLSGASYQVSIPLSYDRWGNRSSEQIKADLDALIAKPGFVMLQAGSISSPMQRVRLTGVRGINETGFDMSGRRDITIVTVPVPESDLEMEMIM